MLEGDTSLGAPSTQARLPLGSLVARSLESRPMTDAPEVVSTASRRSPRVRRVVGFLGVLAVVVVAWELYKVVGEALGGVVPGTELRLRPPPNDRFMPHTWDVVLQLFQPVRRNGELTVLLLAKAAMFTLREALVGFVVGGVIGFGLGVAFVRSTLAERAFMPYVVASQTVPIIAIAPMVVVWGGQLDVPQWLSVAIIAAYLTFFPVTINTVRGLRSPAPTAVEMMRSYAATPSQVLWKLQVPAALPYIFTALKVSATASVIGAIVGELPAGFRDGLGRALLEFSQQFNVKKLMAAVLMSALAGILFVAAVTWFEHRLVAGDHRREG